MRTPAGLGHRLDVATDALAPGERSVLAPACAHGAACIVQHPCRRLLLPAPIKIFEATTVRPVLSLLRPGKRPSGEEVEQILRHVIGCIRRNWPAVEIMVRGDSHFATPEVMDLLEEKHCSYIFGLSTNPRLTEIGRPWS